MTREEQLKEYEIALAKWYKGEKKWIKAQKKGTVFTTQDDPPGGDRPQPPPRP